MSDYFGALLRSAGAVPADAIAPRVTPIGQADLVEQEVEVEVGAAPESATGAQSPEAPAGITAAPSTPAEARPASPDRREVTRSEPVGSPFTRPALDEVHPVVRAALEWVAADPEPVARAVPAVSESAEPQRASDLSPRRQLPEVPAPFAPPATSPDSVTPAATEPVRPRHAPPVPPLEHQAAHEGPPAPARAAAPEQSSPVRDLDLAQPRASRAWPPVVMTMDEPAPPLQDRIEVNIGTIHVRVDAPPAPKAVQPAPPRQRPPQPARPADRSSFSRSRLPRI